METTNDQVRLVTDAVEKKHGLQPGILYRMAETESSLGKNMRSPKGAMGWFQFMPETAKEYGLTNPDDLESSADAAGRYLSDLLKRRGGNYREALADYNYGMGNVDRLKKNHADAWEENLPTETKGYLESILALPKTTSEKNGWSNVNDLPRPNAGGISSADTVGKRGIEDIKHGGFINSILDLPGDIELAGRQYSTLYNIWADKNLEYGDEDLSYLDDSEKVKALTDGMPQEQMDYVLKSRNYNDALRRRKRWEEHTQLANDLSIRGADGFVASLIVGATDLPNVMAMVATGGVGALARSAITARSALLSRTALVGTEATLGGVSNAGIEASTAQWRPTATGEDIENAAYLGAALGGFGGAFGKFENPRLIEENGALRKQALKLWKNPNGFTMEPGTDVVRIYDGEIIPPAPRIGYEYPKLEGPILEGEFTEVMSVEGRVALPGPKVRDDIGAAVVVEKAPPPKSPVKDVTITPKGEPVDKVKDIPEPNSKFGPEWNTPKFDKDGYLELPESNSVHALAAYIRQHTKNEDLKVILNRTLKGMTQGAKLRLKVIEMGRIKVPAGHARYLKNIHNWRGLAVVNIGTGDATVYLRGRSWSNSSHGLNEETFIHELLHANAVSKFAKGKVGQASEEINQAAKDLRKLFQDTKTVYQRSGAGNPRIGWAFQDEDEFLAYGMTNREAQEYLKSIPYGKPKKSLWDAFVRSLRKILRIPDSEANAFTRLIEISSNILKKDTVKAKTALDDEIIAKYQAADETDPGVKAHGFPVIFGWGLSREYRLLNKKVPERIRELAAKIGGNKVGYKDHSVIENSVGEHADTLHRRWTVALSKALWYKSGYDDWFKEMKEAGKYKQIERDYRAKTEFQEMVQDYIRGFDNPDGWHPAVIAAGDGVRKILGGDVLDHINNPAKIFNGQKRGMTQQEIRNPDTGEVELTPALERNPNYLPRKLHYQKISEMVKKIGAEGVQNFFALARKSNHPNISDEAAAKFGKWYYEIFNQSHALGNENYLADMISGVDKNALKMSLMKNGGMSEAEALDVIEDMFPSRPKKGMAANTNLKHRADIDETFTTKMETKDGEIIEVSLNNFIDVNLEQNLHAYFKRMAGDIAFANKLDVYNDSGWETLLNKTVARDLGDSELIPEEKLNRWRKDLNWYREVVKGIPQEASTWWSRSLDMAMKYNVVRLMGMAGLNQAIEWGNLVGALGHKAILSSTSSLDGLYRDIRTGKAPNDLLEQIEDLMGGAGADFVKNSHIGAEDNWVRHSGDTAWNRRLDWASTKLSRGAFRIYKYNGMIGQMVQQQRMYTIGAVNHWFKVATGQLDRSAWLSTNRLAWMGIDDAMFERITANLRKYATVKEGVSGQEAKTVDFNRWQKEDAESMWSFLWGMERESRRIVQENDMASAMPLFDTSIGRAFFQFQGFGFHAWDKALMHGLSQKDLVIFNSVMYSGFIASLQYIGRTYLATAGMSDSKRKDYLEKRLSAQQIVANSYGRVAFASILPQLVDTISPVPVFSGMRSTTDISSVFSSPVFQLINTGIATKKYLRNGLSDEYQTTDRDVKATFNLMMLSNIPPMSILGNAIASKFPSNEQVAPQ